MLYILNFNKVELVIKILLSLWIEYEIKKLINQYKDKIKSINNMNESIKKYEQNTPNKQSKYETK